MFAVGALHDETKKKAWLGGVRELGIELGQHGLARGIVRSEDSVRLEEGGEADEDVTNLSPIKMSPTCHQ